MFWAIVRFELRYHLQNPLFSSTAGLLFLLAFGAVSSDSVQVGGAIGHVYRNAPLVVSNLLVMGAVFFTLAGLTRSMLATYLGVVVSFVAYGISQFLLRELPSQLWGAILDPFGMGAIRVATRYWTIAERNQALPELTGVLLANRLLWMAVGLSVLAFCVLWFDPARALAGGRRGSSLNEPRALPSTLSLATGPRPERRFDLPAQLTMLGHQLRLETLLVLKSAPFIVMLLIGVLNVITAADFSDMIHGTKVLPVTHLMLDTLDGAYLFMLMIIVVVDAGEAIWRDRSRDTAATSTA